MSCHFSVRTPFTMFIRIKLRRQLFNLFDIIYHVLVTSVAVIAAQLSTPINIVLRRPGIITIPWR